MVFEQHRCLPWKAEGPGSFSLHRGGQRDTELPGGGSGDGAGWVMGWGLGSRAGSPLLSPHGVGPNPAATPSDPGAATVLLEKLRCARKGRELPSALALGLCILPHLDRAAAIPGGAPPVQLDTQIPVGVLARVSSLAGVPGAIPGGGVPGGGFFPGKGTWAVWGHHRDGQALGWAPRAPLSPAEQDQGAGTPCPGRLKHHSIGTAVSALGSPAQGWHLHKRQRPRVTACPQCSG